MKIYPLRPPPAPRRAPQRISPFHAVHLRARADGWTPLRQAEFIGHLAETRSVTEAARRVRMSRETAYRLRHGEWSEGFRAAWDAALGKSDASSRSGETIPRKVTNEELQWRIDTGLWHVHMQAGRLAYVSRKGDESALFRLLARLDRAGPAKQERRAAA